MIKVLTACIVLLVLAMHFSTQVDAQTAGNTTTTQATKTTTLNGGGLTVLPGLLGIVLPTALLAALLQHLHC
ncbi:hypothetical protein KOW79_008650 [Hemibagrus wyckioides]|uniref:Uncharacterized protein n=1 Tax=Hemibagrus wyckioides TaxID=337641 RepID=A0A9D3NSK4_9TELE|nr:hypothetical protein KOW79_008650 [Hemibagrus wyckioides]